MLSWGKGVYFILITGIQKNEERGTDLLFYLALLFSTILFHVYIFRNGVWDLDRPLFLEGDASYLYVLAKTILDTGWIWNHPLLSYPYGYLTFAFPFLGFLDCVLVMLASFLTGDCFAAANLALMLSMVLAGVFAFFCIRLLEGTRTAAFVIALLYVFIPAAYYRNISHFGIQLHSIPPLATGAVVIFTDFWRRLTGRQITTLFFLIFVCSFSIVYFPFFALLCSGTALLFGFSYSEDKKRFLKYGCAVILTILLGFTLNYGPAFVVMRKYSGVRENIIRYPVEADLYGLRIRDLLRPVDANPFPPLRALAQKINEVNYPLSTENTGARMGTVFSFGFLLLLAVLFTRGKIRLGDPSLGMALSLLVLICVLWGTIGGFGSLFNLLVSPALRSLNRISHFIAFFCAVAVASLISVWERIFVRMPRHKVIYAFFMIALFGFGLYDQRPFDSYATNPNNSVLIPTREMVTRLMERFPVGTNVLHLPFHAIERPSPQLPHDAAGFPFLLTEGYGWSTFASLPEARRNLDFLCHNKGLLLIAWARYYGFGAIWIDKRGYEDSGESLLQSLEILPKLQRVAENELFILLDIREVDTTGIDLSEPQDITFGVDGNDALYIHSGFSGPERGFRWTEGHEAVFRFKAEKMTSRRYYVSFDIYPFLYGDRLSSQRVEVYANGLKLADWVINQPVDKVLLLPKNTSGGDYNLSFKLPDAASPKAVGLNEDVRVLGLGFRKIQFTPAGTTKKCLPQNGVIWFGLAGNDYVYIDSGFSDPERGFRWTEGHEAVLAFNAEDAGELLRKGGTVSLDVAPLVGGPLGEQRVEVLVNGQKVDYWVLSERCEKEIVLPALPKEDALYTLTFRFPDAASPKELGINEDGRALGLAFFSMRFSAPR